MPVSGPAPVAVDLDVFQLGTADAVITRDDVERALYALTGWQKPQHLVDAMLDVVDSYATGVRLERVVPERVGHTVVREPCARAHLDEHQCPITVKTERPVVDCTHGCRDAADAADALTRLGQEMDVTGGVNLEPARPATDPWPEEVTATPNPKWTPGIVALTPEELAKVATRKRYDVEVAPPTRKTRYAPAMTPDALLNAEPSSLTPAQRAARQTLLLGEQACSSCGETKPLDEYYRDKSRLTGHMGRCKGCARR